MFFYLLFYNLLLLFSLLFQTGRSHCLFLSVGLASSCRNRTLYYWDLAFSFGHTMKSIPAIKLNCFDCYKQILFFLSYEESASINVIFVFQKMSSTPVFTHYQNHH